MRRKLLTLFILVFWVITSSTYAFDLNLDQYSYWGANPEWKIDRINRYAISTDKGNYIYLDSNPRLWYSFGFTGFDFYWELNSRYNYAKFAWFSYKNENEWITFYQAKYKWAVQYYNTFSIPSRTAYQYTNSIGNKFLFSEIFLNDNQFTLYDPESNYWVSWIGDVRLENLMLISNPWKEEQNVFLIQLQKQKAFSLTVDKNKAWEIWKGNWVNKAFLKNLNFEKSYTLTSWGNYIFPVGFKQVKQWRGFIYTEDIELQSMDWWGGKPDDKFQWWGGQSWGKWAVDWDYSHRLSEYNQCVSYRQNIKTYSKYLNSCSLWANQSWPINATESQRRRVLFMKLALWNWESDIDVSSDDYDCYRYKQVKSAYIKKYWDKWQEFKKEAESDEYSDLDISVKCWGRPSLKIKEWTEEKWLLDKIQDGFYRFRDNFNELWGKPIVSSGGQNLYNYDYRKDIEQLKFLREYCQWWTIIDKYLQTEEQYEAMKKSYCERYDKLKKEIERKYANWTWFYNGKSLSWALRDIENWADRDYNVWIWKKFVSLITDSFYSGYNSVDFVVPVCWKDNKNSFFEIFFYLFFFLTVFYLFKVFK